MTMPNTKKKAYGFEPQSRIASQVSLPLTIRTGWPGKLMKYEIFETKWNQMKPKYPNIFWKGVF